MGNPVQLPDSPAMRSRGLTNIYLDNLCRTMVGNDVFLGVYSCDELQLLLPRDVSAYGAKTFIVNFSRRAEPGTHFVAMEVCGDNLIYFDSLGFPFTTDKNIVQFAEKGMYKVVDRWIVPIQHIASNFCGYYCAAFVAARHRRWSSAEFYDKFIPYATFQNDQKSVNIVVSHIQSQAKCKRLKDGQHLCTKSL